MTTILGIDAAWTAKQPSGVALIQAYEGRWRCLAAAPSYESFEHLSLGTTCDWSQKSAAGEANVGQLIARAEYLAGEELCLAAVDMPVSTAAIKERRAADRAVSRCFGSQGCSTHSPSPIRPGQLGATLTQQFHAAGFEVATTATAPSSPNRLVEVYPHPALLTLLGRNMRAQYKVGKSSKYWPGVRTEVRIERLLAEFEAILDGLSVHIDGIWVPLPRPRDVQTLSGLKRFEDAIDALVCCWVGSRYLDNEAYALGDETAAIWCPR